MKKKKLLLLLWLLNTTFLFAQDKEFWFVAPDVADGHWDGPTFFVFSNPSKTDAATIKIDLYAGAAPGTVGWDTTVIVSPESFYKLDFSVDSTRRMVENPAVFQGNINNYGVHITSDVKILAYYMVHGKGQRDIFTLKGQPALGTHFITPFHKQDRPFFYHQAYDAFCDDGADQIDIVATENGTNITVDLKKACVVGLTGTRLPIGTHTFNGLQKGQTLKLKEDTVFTGPAFPIFNMGDVKNYGTLAGSEITSNNPIAVTTTEDCIAAQYWQPTGRTGGGIDLAGDQIVPTDMVGKNYVVLQGHSTVGERVDFVAINNNTIVNVQYLDGTSTIQTIASPVLNKGDIWYVDMARLTSVFPYDSADIFVDATEPVYCYQHSAVKSELGAAIIPSMYSISQQRIDFYQGDGDPLTLKNEIFLVFRKDCDTTFTISYDGGPEQPLHLATTVTPQPVPSTLASDWRYAKVTLPAAGIGRMVTIKNGASPFSLGYFNGDKDMASFGYLSGFGSFSFDPDTIWRCHGTPYSILSGGYARSYKWTLPDGSIRTTPAIKAVDPGMYILEMDQDPRLLIDTCWVYDLTFQADFNKKPADPKPIKVGVPQDFNIDINPEFLSNPGISVNFNWTFRGGVPSTSTAASPTVIWNASGETVVTLHITATAGTGANVTLCDTTITKTLQIMPKIHGYFVKQNGGDDNNGGSSWQDAFNTVQRALELASQGDYIWVAKGNYKPAKDKETFVINYDSVQLFGGFRGDESNLNERQIALNPTYLNGYNNSVVTFDGSTQYTNGHCGTSTDARLDGFIIKNGNSQNGGGILFTNGASGTIANCVIKQNNAEGKGGGVYTVLPSPLCGHTSPVIVNTEISGNKAADGAGLYNEGGDLRLLNVTISGNKASVAANGMYIENGSPSVENTIIWGNTFGNNDNEKDIINHGTPTYTYSTIGGSRGSGSNWNTEIGIDGDKNKDMTPFFRRSGYDSFGNMQEGNYRLSAGSSSVNTGRNSLVMSNIFTPSNIVLLNPKGGTTIEGIPNDLDGSERIDFDIVDRGAYEYMPGNDSIDVKRKVIIPLLENATTDPEEDHTYYVSWHDDFILTIYPDEGYGLDHIKITTGSSLQDKNMSTVKNEDGSITITFHEVSEPLYLQIENISPLSNQNLESFAMWSNNSQLHLKTSTLGSLQIFSLTGQLIRQQQITEHETSIPLSRGMYIVSLNNSTKQKVLIK